MAEHDDCVRYQSQNEKSPSLLECDAPLTGCLFFGRRKSKDEIIGNTQLTK